ncbi:MAG: hypothetical protein Q8R01_14620 [Ramlibacter sp.]|nr:hypothetical protein [Ramlibacter sp.]
MASALFYAYPGYQGRLKAIRSAAAIVLSEEPELLKECSDIASEFASLADSRAHLAHGALREEWNWVTGGGVCRKAVIGKNNSQALLRRGEQWDAERIRAEQRKYAALGDKFLPFLERLAPFAKKWSDEAGA